MTDERKQQLLNLALDSEPFDVHNHVKIVAVDDGWAQVEVEIHPETLNRWGTPHGGILFTLSDVACGMAILTTRMEACVILINNARGQLIDKQDVADALNCGKMAAAGLDVVYTEPIRADNPLLKAKNCIITPHISWAPKVSRQRIMDTSAARCISTAMFSPLCPNPRSKLWQKCSRRSTSRRAKKHPARRRKPWSPSCAP